MISRRFAVSVRGLVAAVVLVMTINLLIAVPTVLPAGALRADPPTGNVPVLCEDDTVAMGPSGHHYSAVWVPPGGRFTMVAEGTLFPQFYVFGTFVVHYLLKFHLTIDGVPEDGPRLIAADMSTQFSASPHPFGPHHFYSWTNFSDRWKLVGVDAWADLILNEGGIDWTFMPRVDGATPSRCSRPVPGSELFGPNPSTGQQCPPCTGGTANSVDTRSGNEHWTLPGVAVAGRGPGLDFQVAHNSRDVGFDGPMGPGWRHSYDMALSLQPDGSRVVFQETGATVPFAETSPGNWTAPERFDAELKELPDGTWEFLRGRTETFVFNESGQLITIRDRNGYETTLGYEGLGLDYVQDEAGRRLNFTWSNGRLTKVAAPATAAGAREITMQYAGGELTSYTDVGGGAWALDYDDSSRLTSVRSPRFSDPAKAWRFHYDSEGRVDWEEDPQGRRTELHYDDPQVGATRVVEPDGDARVDWYDASGMRTKMTLGYGSAGAADTELNYDAQTGALTSTVDGRGKVWTTQYADANNPHRATKTIDPLGRERNMSYDADGQLVSLTDAAGAISTWTYDAAGNLQQSAAAVGTPSAAVTTNVYGDSAHPGDVTKVVDPRGKEWRHTYDATTGDRISTTDPLGNKTTWGYNTVGWVTSTVPPAGNSPGADAALHRSTIEHNTYGAPVRVVDAAGEQTMTAYDADGNVIRVEQPDGGVLERTWTDGGQLATETSGVGTPAERTTSYTYWADGRPKTWSSDPQSVWTSDWDASGRLKSQTDPNGKATRFAYDAAGNLASVTQAGGDCGAVKVRCITYQRDNAGQVTTVDFSDPTTPDVVQTYDGNGRRLTQNVAGQGTATWEWTKRGHLKSQTDAVGQTVDYRWDPAGNLKELVYPGQTVPVVYGYDDASRMTGVTDWTGNHTDFSYDANSNLTEAQYPADTGLVDRWTYDNRNQINSVTWEHTAGSGGPLGTIDYGRDPEGQITSATTAGVPAGATDFDYDARDQLTASTRAGASSASDPGFGIYSYDDRGYLTRDPESLHQYDAAGQLDSSATQIKLVGSARTFDALGLATTLTVNLPEGIRQDDQIFLVSTNSAGASIGSPPAGYALLTTAENAGGARVAVYRKTATGAETSATVTVGGGLNKSLIAVVYRGVDATDPVVGFTGASSTTGTSLAVPEINAPLAGTHLVLAAGGIGNLLPAAVVAPESMTEQVPVDDRLLVTGVIADETITATGPTGSRDLEFSQAQAKAAVLLALRPERSTHAYDAYGNRTRTTTPHDETQYTYDQANRLKTVDGIGGYSYDGDGLRTQAPISGTDTHFTWARGLPLPLMLTETPKDAAGVLDPTRTRSYIYGPGGQILTHLDAENPVELVGTRSTSVFTTGLSIPLPSGIKADDQILLAVTHTSASTPTVPNGYVEAGSRTSSGTVVRLWRRTASGDEAASLSVSFANGLGSAKSAVSMVYRGIDTTDPIVDFDGAGVTGTDVVIPSLDTESAGNQVVAILGTAGGLHTTTAAWTPPTGFTLREQTSKSSLLAGIGTAAADRKTTNSAPTGTMAFGFNMNSKIAGIGVVLRKTGQPERWYHADALGSTRILTDQRGRVVGKASYTAYGQPVAPTGEKARLGYAGQYTDPDSGLVYLRARYYDPATSQFLTRDPLLDVSQDPYSYAANDPVNLTDPTGLFPPILVAVAVGALIGGGMDLTVQVAGNVLQGCPALQDLNWGQVGLSALAGGALPGGLGLARFGDDLAGIAFRGNTSHIFRNAKGHLADDTARNRALIKSALGRRNLHRQVTLGDGSTLKVYRRTRRDGTQVWAEVRNGTITNGGLNVTPR